MRGYLDDGDLTLVQGKIIEDGLKLVPPRPWKEGDLRRFKEKLTNKLQDNGRPNQTASMTSHQMKGLMALAAVSPIERVWTVIEEARLVSLVCLGRSAYGVAILLQRQIPDIRERMAKLGLCFREPAVPLFPGGLPGGATGNGSLTAGAKAEPEVEPVVAEVVGSEVAEVAEAKVAEAVEAKVAEIVAAGKKGNPRAPVYTVTVTQPDGNIVQGTTAAVNDLLKRQNSGK